MTNELGLGVDVRNCRTSNLLVSRAVTDVVDKRLAVGGDPESDGAIDTIGDYALAHGQVDRVGSTADHHVAEKTL